MPREIADRYYRSDKEFNPHVSVLIALPNQTLPEQTITDSQIWAQSILPVTFTPTSITVFEGRGYRDFSPGEHLPFAS